jgi:hypothetical protein
MPIADVILLNVWLGNVALKVEVSVKEFCLNVCAVRPT